MSTAINAIFLISISFCLFARYLNNVLFEFQFVFCCSIFSILILIQFSICCFSAQFTVSMSSILIFYVQHINKITCSIIPRSTAVKSLIPAWPHLAKLKSLRASFYKYLLTERTQICIMFCVSSKSFMQKHPSNAFSSR